jgi:hypothetical protein
MVLGSHPTAPCRGTIGRAAIFQNRWLKVRDHQENGSLGAPKYVIRTLPNYGSGALGGVR